MNSFTLRANVRPRQTRPQRTPVLMQASVATMSAYQFPELVDVSQTGAKLRGLKLPPKGATALLKAGPLEALCRVVWVQGEHCGIRFDETITRSILNAVQREGAVTLEGVTPAPGVDLLNLS